MRVPMTPLTSYDVCAPSWVASEVERLVRLYNEARAKFAREPAKAKEFATNPLGPLPKGIDDVDAAAWTAVANVLLNLDEMLMKP